MFGWIASAYNWATGKIDGTIAGWVHDIVKVLYGWLHSLFGEVIKAWDSFYKEVSHYASEFEDYVKVVGEAFYYLWKVWYRKYVAWVEKYILGPLHTAIKWILNEGATLWYYIQHPGKLVDLIWDSVLSKFESDGTNVAEKLGTFFTKLILKNVKWLLAIVEDIIHASL